MTNLWISKCLFWLFRKDRAQIHSKYQDLLRHKVLLEGKCQNLARELTRYKKGGVDAAGVKKEESEDEGVALRTSTQAAVSDFSKIWIDLMSDLAKRATSSGLNDHF